MEQEEERKFYHAGDYEALSIGKDEENQVEYWFNPLLGVAEPFVGFIYTREGPERCAKNYPIVKGVGIPEIFVVKNQEDGSTTVKVRQRVRVRRFVDYRIALGMLFVPIFAWAVEKIVKNQRK